MILFSTRFFSNFSSGAIWSFPSPYWLESKCVWFAVISSFVKTIFLTLHCRKTRNSPTGFQPNVKSTNCYRKDVQADSVSKKCSFWTVSTLSGRLSEVVRKDHDHSKRNLRAKKHMHHHPRENQTVLSTRSQHVYQDREVFPLSYSLSQLGPEQL